jgi:hypothetical protein
MDLGKVFHDLREYFSGAVARIFSPRDDEFPATGVQPFEGDIPERSQSTEW